MLVAQPFPKLLFETTPMLLIVAVFLFLMCEYPIITDGNDFAPLDSHANFHYNSLLGETEVCQLEARCKRAWQ